MTRSHRALARLVPVTAAWAGSLTWACADGTGPGGPLEQAVRAVTDTAPGEVAVYYADVGSGEIVAVNADVRMHAASTMKVPVLVQLVLDDADRPGFLSDSVVVRDTFVSIVDGSSYRLDPASDSDSTLYGRIGETVEVRELAELMITVSSNLATNLLIERADPRRVTGTMRALGADSIEVLRGVEDLRAFEAGLSNTTTARDLGVVLDALARGSVGDRGASEAVLDILSRQHFRDMIPAGVPPGTRVASKDGWITGIRHDAAVIYPEGADPYVLVVLTRGFDDRSEAEALGARISRLAWDHHMSGGS